MTNTKLKEQVQKIRDAVKIKIQLGMINTRLTSISNSIRAINVYKEDIEKNKKEIEIAEYNLTKVDTKHPAKEEITENQTKQRDYTVKTMKERNENLERLIKTETESIAKNETDIEKIEESEIKITLDKLNQETEEAIREMRVN